LLLKIRHGKLGTRDWGLGLGVRNQRSEGRSQGQVTNSETIHSDYWNDG
jgi:hypothetical protein